MNKRSPLHDRTDAQLVHRLIRNMKDRAEGALAIGSIVHDIRVLEEEIAFSEERIRVLRERCSLAATESSASGHAQVFATLLQETEQELYRLYNARQFLRAEKMTADGVPKEQIAEVLTMGDSLIQNAGII